MSNKRNPDPIDDEMDEPDFGGSKKRLNTYADSKDKTPIYESPTPERASYQATKPMDMLRHQDDNVTNNSLPDNESVADSGIHHKPCAGTEPEPVAESGARDDSSECSPDVEDEFIDEDDLGFNFISISPAKARVASQKLAEE